MTTHRLTQAPIACWETSKNISGAGCLFIAVTFDVICLVTGVSHLIVWHTRPLLSHDLWGVFPPCGARGRALRRVLSSWDLFLNYYFLWLFGFSWKSLNSFGILSNFRCLSQERQVWPPTQMNFTWKMITKWPVDSSGRVGCALFWVTGSWFL